MNIIDIRCHNDLIACPYRKSIITNVDRFTPVPFHSTNICIIVFIILLSKLFEAVLSLSEKECILKHKDTKFRKSETNLRPEAEWIPHRREITN